MSEETAPYQPDETFIGAKAGLELFDEPLRNFSYSRKVAAQTMGCMAPAIGAGFDQMKTTGLYPGAFNDTIIVLWLCRLKDNSEITGDEWRAGEFTPERAMRQPAEALEKAHAWAEVAGMTDIVAPNFLKAYEVFMQIVFGIEASAFEVKVDTTGSPPRGDGDPKTTPGLPKSPASSRRSHGRAGKRKALSGKK